MLSLWVFVWFSWLGVDDGDVVQLWFGNCQDEGDCKIEVVGAKY